MTSKFLNRLATLAVAVIIAGPAFAQENPALFQARANGTVAQALAFPNQWNGPTSGPAITRKKLVVMIGSDFRLAGVSGLAANLREVSHMVGWQFLTFSCYGMVKERPEAFSRALALKPSAIIMAGLDAGELSSELKAAAKEKIPVIGWHAGPTPGPTEGLFTNVETSPQDAGQVAALLSVVDSQGKAGVVVLTDSSNAYSTLKANAIIDTLKQCQTCSLLSVEDVPFSSNPTHIKDVLTGLVAKYGTHWTHVLATNDLFFDMMSTPAASTIISANKLEGISAGDGSPSAYQRIRSGRLQIGTVPEPLKMQAWQLIDEVNRATSGAKPSGFTTQTYLVTRQNNSFQGGPQNNFEPDNNYQAAYRKIWKK